MELNRSVDVYVMMIVIEYFDDLRFRWWDEHFQIYLAMVPKYRQKLMMDFNFQSFCVFYNILAPDFVHVCSDTSMKDANKVHCRKYWSQRSFEGYKKGVDLSKK